MLECGVMSTGLSGIVTLWDQEAARASRRIVGNERRESQTPPLAVKPAFRRMDRRVHHRPPSERKALSVKGALVKHCGVRQDRFCKPFNFRIRRDTGAMCFLIE